MQELHNVMEDCVEQKLNSILPMMEQYCSCEKCRVDMEAYALNRLPAKYVHSDRGLSFRNLIRCLCRRMQRLRLLLRRRLKQSEKIQIILLKID